MRTDMRTLMIKSTIVPDITIGILAGGLVAASTLCAHSFGAINLAEIMPLEAAVPAIGIGTGILAGLITAFGLYSHYSHQVNTPTQAVIDKMNTTVKNYLSKNNTPATITPTH